MSTARLSTNASTRVLLSSARSYSTLSSRVARSTNTRTSLQNASLLAHANTNNLASPRFGIASRLFSTTMTNPGKCIWLSFLPLSYLPELLGRTTFFGRLASSWIAWLQSVEASIPAERPRRRSLEDSSSSALAAVMQLQAAFAWHMRAEPCVAWTVSIYGLGMSHSASSPAPPIASQLVSQHALCARVLRAKPSTPRFIFLA